MVQTKMHDAERNVKKLEERLNKARAQLAEAEATPKDELLADALHRALCSASHEDRCGWFYEKDWNGYAHKEYLRRARKALKIADTDTILGVMKAVRG